MANFKLVIGTKDGKCHQKDVSDDQAEVFLRKKIRDKIEGSACGFDGYEFEVTGGSDHCGFPMRWDVDGNARKRILAVSGVGLRKKGKGIKQRKTVCGNTIHGKITQINLKVLKEGKQPLVEPQEEKAEGGEEAPQEEAPKKEVKEEKPEEKPSEESKEEKKD